MKYLHTMIRVRNLESALDFFINKLGMIEVRRKEVPEGKFTLVFLAAAEDEPPLELTYNWDRECYTGGRNFGHLAFQVADVYRSCQRLIDCGVMLSRPPRDGRMAFIRSPDNISIELLQSGAPLAAVEPWVSMPNSGEW